MRLTDCNWLQSIWDNFIVQAMMCLPCWVHGYFLSQLERSELNALIAQVGMKMISYTWLTKAFESARTKPRGRCSWRSWLRFPPLLCISCSGMCVSSVCARNSSPVLWQLSMLCDMWGGARKAQAQSLAHVEMQRQVDLCVVDIFCD